MSSPSSEVRRTRLSPTKRAAKMESPVTRNKSAYQGPTSPKTPLQSARNMSKVQENKMKTTPASKSNSRNSTTTKTSQLKESPKSSNTGRQLRGRTLSETEEKKVAKDQNIDKKGSAKSVDNAIKNTLNDSVTPDVSSLGTRTTRRIVNSPTKESDTSNIGKKSSLTKNQNDNIGDTENVASSTPTPKEQKIKQDAKGYNSDESKSSRDKTTNKMDELNQKGKKRMAEEVITATSKRRRVSSDNVESSQEIQKKAVVESKEDEKKVNTNFDVQEMFSPRRSSRSVVPNRKFKDMEVEYTPNKCIPAQGMESSSDTATKIKGNKPSKSTKVEGKTEGKRKSEAREKEKLPVQENSTTITVSNDIEMIGDESAVEVIESHTNSDGDANKSETLTENNDSEDNESFNDNRDASIDEDNNEINSFDVNETMSTLDPVTGIISELDKNDNSKMVVDSSSVMQENSDQVLETENDAVDSSDSKGDNKGQDIESQDVSSPKENILGTLTVVESETDGTADITSDDIHIENVPVVEVTLSSDAGSDLAIIESFGEIVETIESSSYDDKAKSANNKVSDKSKSENSGESVQHSTAKITEEFGREVEKLIEISKNLEKGQATISDKDNKNIFVKRLSGSGPNPVMPGRITATIIKNTAAQSVKEVPIQSSEGKSKIILLSGNKDLIEKIPSDMSKEKGTTSEEKGTSTSSKESLTNAQESSNQQSASQESVTSDTATDQSGDQDSNSDAVDVISATEIVTETNTTSDDTATTSDISKKSGMTSSFTQTPLAKASILANRNRSKGPVFKTITVNVQQPAEEGSGEEEGGEQRSNQFVIVHLPEGASIKKAREDKHDDIPFKELDDGSLGCTLCSYATFKKSNWYKHKKKHQLDAPLRNHKCSKCNYIAGSSSNLKRHMMIHEDIREFSCHLCDMMFRQKIHLERHVKYRHEEKRIKCPFCEYVCANENPDLKIHMKRKHLPSGNNDEEGTIQAYSCDQCGLVTISKKDLKQHLKFHKKGPELKLFCQHCSFVTDCESRLKRHLLIHTKEKPFQCGLCQYRATQKEHVLRHMKSQHQIEVIRQQKRRSLENSSVDDDSDSNLEADKKNEPSDFSSQEKIFACNHCSMKFAKLINLYKHLHAQHNDVLPDTQDGEHLCVVCDFRTATKKNLLVHMRKHNLQDQNPPSHVYSCVLCKYINPKRRSLFQHMKKKHQIEIVMKDDGSTSCFVTDNTPVIMNRDESVSNILTVGDIVTATTEDTPLQIVTDDDKDPIHVQNVITMEDLAYAVSHPQQMNGVIIVEENQEEEESNQIESVTPHEAAEAIEGLQALAEQPGIVEGQEVITYDTQQLVIDESQPEMEKVQTSDGVLETEVVTMETQDASNEANEEKMASDFSNIQLSHEQLASLSTGDYVEINGEMYKVEISSEENSITVNTV